ncbi:MAG: ABC transporter substrate-binding protein [Lachnospiraceae bacterium]
MQESDFFRHPVGTGPYKLADWEEGQAITLEKNVMYFQGEPNIDTLFLRLCR